MNNPPSDVTTLVLVFSPALIRLCHTEIDGRIFEHAIYRQDEEHDPTVMVGRRLQLPTLNFHPPMLAAGRVQHDYLISAGGSRILRSRIIESYMTQLRTPIVAGNV
ncbi:hypothetical protein LZ31DRAFT_596880 [Colletotrichum somersetense]|nr:hypothetical protein LZ31DRAFT_596880 [Colletotrichum somersetense]